MFVLYNDYNLPSMHVLLLELKLWPS